MIIANRCISCVDRLNSTTVLLCIRRRHVRTASLLNVCEKTSSVIILITRYSRWFCLCIRHERCLKGSILSCILSVRSSSSLLLWLSRIFWDCETDFPTVQLASHSRWLGFQQPHVWLPLRRSLRLTLGRLTRSNFPVTHCLAERLNELVLR